MTQHYLIADHLVALTLPDAWSTMLPNYVPFSTQAAEAPLYHLTVHPEEAPAWDERQHVFTDTSDDDMPRIEVYRLGTDWLFRVSMYKEGPVCCAMRCTDDFSEAQLWLHTEDVRFAIDNAAMLLFAFRTAPLGTLEMHASVVLKDGFGHLFLGHSGTGKSTHSRMWMEAFGSEVELLNDDNPILRLLPDGEVRVYGSPWSGKTPCYHQQSAPVRAIVKLSQAPCNEARRLRLPEAYAYMLSSASGLKIVPEMMDHLYHTIATIIQSVGMFHLDCLPNTDAARVCLDTVKS